MNNTQTKFSVEGITCGGCANSIKSALGRLKGVSSVEVDVPGKTVVVAHDEEQASREVVIDALGKAGFRAH